jgi:uncharacterized membrane protein
VRNPLRTEAEAFSFVLVAAVCFLALALAVVFGGRWVGIAVFLALVLGVAVGIYIRAEPKVHEPAVWDRRAPDGTLRILAVVDDSIESEALRAEILRRVDGQDAEVLVVAAGLRRGARYDSDAEVARAAAARRADDLAAAVGDSGATAWGTVGDADPLRAAREALRTFHADEVIVAGRLHEPG